LLISHLEVRTDESIDIKSYIFGRDVEKIVVSLGKDEQELKYRFFRFIDKYVHKLQRLKAVYGANTEKVFFFLS